jgi:hypothetical protein
MKRARRQQGKGGFDLIEEATHLLRTAPAATLAVYYLGAIPFVLGLLYFWADMSRSPFAGQHLADAALGMAGLYLWMKCCQAVFARRLRAHAAARPMPRWTAGICWRLFLNQTIVQPTGLFVIPFSLVPLLPAAWVYAFYQNATALDDGDPAGTLALVKKSWKQAMLWPRQNHFVLSIMAGFGLFVFFDWQAVCFTLPGLVKMLFGVESAFARSPWSMLNTTFFTATVGLTYLCVDPILKSIYVLRCFYGESLESGEDLRAELNAFRPALPSVAVLAALLLISAGAVPVGAGDTPPATAPAPAASATAPIAPADLDRALNQTIHEARYTWRMPREKIVEPAASEGPITRFLDKVGKLLRKWIRATLEWLMKWLDKLFRPPLPRSLTSSTGSGYGWIMLLQILLYGLVAAMLSALAILLYRVWRARRRTAVLISEPIQPAPDLADENVHAGQLPEDGWLSLGRELLGRGEFRLALRAFFLASLAHLAARDLIRLARFKSNHDYERELGRRGHSIPDLLPVFADNLLSFERIWYGTHEAGRETVDRFVGNVERMRAAG